MEILCVDDEMLALELLEDSVKAAVDTANVHSFCKPKEALAYVSNGGVVDIAFLDVEMRGMTGVELAEKLKATLPFLNIIFVTGFGHYATDAMNLRASGYVTKPVSVEKIKCELKNLRYSVKNLCALCAQREQCNVAFINGSCDPKTGVCKRLLGSNAPAKKLEVRCFGNFEVFYNGQPLKFSRGLAKEAFAYLIDRRGSSCTIRELAAVLFEDKPYDSTRQSYLQSIISSLMKTFESVGARECIIKSYNSIAVDVNYVDCDYYKFLASDESERDGFWGEYMSQYSWAELTAANLSLNF